MKEIEQVEKEVIHNVSYKNQLACEGLKLLFNDAESKERNNAVMKEYEDVTLWHEEELKRKEKKEMK